MRISGLAPRLAGPLCPRRLVGEAGHTNFAFPADIDNLPARLFATNGHLAPDPSPLVVLGDGHGDPAGALGQVLAGNRVAFELVGDVVELIGPERAIQDRAEDGPVLDRGLNFRMKRNIS